jgi:RHS repeat-associated protein
MSRYGTFEAKSPNKAGWNPVGGGSPEVCRGVQCSQSATGQFFWQEGLPSGEDTVEFFAKDGVGLTAEVSEKVKVDTTRPYAIALSGLPANKELGDSEVKVKASAKDGSEAFSGSGIESIALKIEGKEIGSASGSCSPGPCTATSGEWTINGAEYAAGQHKLTVTATSYAGDVATEEFAFDTGHLATPVALGPGSVSPETGEFFLNATDVSVDGPGAALSVKRSYSSSHLAAGAEGPLGPQWIMSVGGSQSLTKAAEGAVVLTDAEGQESVFTSKGKGEFNSPPNSSSLVLTEVLEKEKTKEFLLKDGSGQVTKFTLPGDGTGSTWVPARLEGPGATNVVTYAFRTVGAITEPTEVLAPVPVGVSCTGELVKGCRALEFVYATKTTATGDGSSEWGEYEGRLKEVTFTAWEPVSGKMKTTAVAEYVYDQQGKLRGEWDPAIAPALETTYGYDAAGHVTAMTPPGQQPWLFDYGTTTKDPRARIVSVTRPSASTAAGDGAAPVNTAVPVLSNGTARIGMPLSVSNGTWSNSPLSYAYQWESCTTIKEAEVCAPIQGATSQTYTPEAVTGEWLVATVTATNADGSATAATAHNSSERIYRGVAFKEAAAFGKEGSGEGQVKEPSAISVETASGSAGDVWVADTGNNRIDKFTASGTFVASYGSKGKENGQFEGPVGIALSETDKYVYVADAGNKRIEVFEAKTGKYLSQVSVPAAPAGIAVGKTHVEAREEAALFVTVPSKNYVKEYTAEEKPEAGYTIGSTGTGNGELKEPTGVTVSETGYAREGTEGEGWDLFVTDKGNHRVEVFESKLFKYQYVAKFGSEGSGEGQFEQPENIALEPEKAAYSGIAGDVLVSDTANDRVQISSTAGVAPFDRSFGSGRQSLAVNTASGASDGDVYIASAAISSSPRITKWVPEAPQINPPEPPNLGTSAVITVEYHVPVSGSGAPYALGKTEAEAWGQKDVPTEATAIFPPDEPMGWPARDYKRATLYYLDSSARTVNVARPGGAISTSEYNAKGDIERILSPDNRAAALKEGSKSGEVSRLLDTQNTYNSEGNELQSSLGPQHNVELANGSQVQARDHKQLSYEEGAPSEGGPYGLPTKTTEGAEYSGKEEDVRETTTSYSGQENLGWKLREPTSVTASPKGLKVTHTTVYEASTGAVKETVMPAGNPKEKTPHGTETIYYTTAKNASTPACGEHPEWANLPCQTQPSKQPETSGLPNLPVTTNIYNMWDESEKTTETVGSTTRTKTTTYDAAGRLKTSAISSSVGTALPTVTDEYNTENGALEKTSTTTEGKTKTLTSVFNKLGELTSYTDADENTATYSYDIDGRVHEATDGKGTQTYTYDPTTGDLTKLVDSAAGTFTATYDTEGNMLTELYPDGLSANYTYNAVGVPTSLQYEKTTHCTEKCVWLSDMIVPSIHGQWLSQTSSLSSQSYKYDEAGRLTQVQSTPAGGGCTTRIYAYDEDTNRTGLTTRAPGSKGECTGEGGTVEKHSYDSADRLTDTGTTYSTFGNITALPAADAGGSELTSAYYTDNQLASQTQNGETIGYNLDPSGRTRETVATGKTSADIINHYGSAGDSPAWTIETPSGDWTRNIQGIGGGVVAIQANGTTPVLQLTDLHGDIIATAALGETETKLLSTTDSSEYGVPTTSTPAKYSWLGNEQQPTELPSGVIQMGARSYIPQLGRFLQTDPIPGGSANAYAYTFGDPVNSSDPSGELTYGFSGWLKEQNNQEAQEVVAREVARETLEREEAERRAAEAEAAAAASDAPEAQEPLGGYPGWACEYAAETHQEGAGCGPSAEEMAEIFGCTGDHACSSSIFGSVVHWVSSNAHKLVAAGIGAVASIVVGAVTLVAVTACSATAELTEDPFVAYDCYKIGSIGFTVAIAGAASAVQAWKVEKH